ncbi:MAG: TolC family protein [Myxococcales bacterium]|nr:TolC family protein [Myxococcales bacterium]
MRFLSILVAAAVCGLSTAATVRADHHEKTVPPRYSRPAGGITIGPDSTALPTDGVVRLSLDEAIRIGLVKNLSVQAERYSPYLAREDQKQAWGAYDPVFSGGLDWSDIHSPNSFSLNTAEVSKDEKLGGSAGLKGSVPYLGTSYEIALETGRTETNNSITSFSPQYDSSINFIFRQPLLRNLVWSNEWTQIRRAELGVSSSLQEFRSSTMDTVASIEDAYWLLIARREQVRVDRKSLETTRALLDQTQTQFDVGVVSKVEVIEAEAGVAEREFNLIVSENAYQNSEDLLIDLVYGAELRAVTDISLEPTERPDDYVVFEVVVAQSAKMAFELRPELEVARDAIERQETEVRFAKNQRLPSLDAMVSYGNRNQSGFPNPNLNPNFLIGSPGPPPSSDYGDSYTGFIGDAPRQLTAGAVLSIPLLNQTARAGVSKAEVALRRSHTNLRRVEQTVVLEVRSAARGLDAARKGILAAERRSGAAEEQLRAEKIRLEYGESTPFDVLQRERDLVDAESQKIEALRAYRAAATRLDRSQGTILRSRKISIEEVAELR